MNRVRRQNIAAVQQASTVSFIQEGAIVRTVPEVPGFPAQQADSEIREAIRANLAAKGYDFLPSNGSADLLIGYSIGAREESDQYIEAYRGRFGQINHISTREDNYIEGSLVIDLIDAESGQVVWSGWVERDIRSPLRDRRSEVISEAVRAIVTELPAR